MDFLKAFGIEDDANKSHKQIVYSMALIYNIIYDEMPSFFQQYDLTPGKFNILMIIKHQGKDHGIPQVEIGKHLILTPSNMTKLIDKLEKDGLVARFALKGDRRVNIIKVTKKGSDLLGQIWESYNEKLAVLTLQISRNDQKILSKLLLSWLKALKGDVAED